MILALYAWLSYRALRLVLTARAIRLANDSITELADHAQTQRHWVPSIAPPELMD